MKYLSPGSRKGYPFVMITGRYNGRMIELRTGCRTRPHAQLWFARWEQEQRAGAAAEAPTAPPPPARDYRTFGEAISAYARYHQISVSGPGLSADDRKNGRRLQRLITALGEHPVGAIHRQDLLELAATVYPQGSAASKNREILTPARAVLNFVAELNPSWCAAPKIKSLPTLRPAPRAVGDDIEIRLLAAAAQLSSRSTQTFAGEHHLLLLWLFRAGTRITDTLRVVWEDPGARGERLGVNLSEGVVRLVIHKTQHRHELPLSPELLAALKKVPEDRRRGRVFHWRTRSGVYTWLRPLCDTCGVYVTPHMARHTVGTRLAAARTPLPALMAALTHRSVASSLVYQGAAISETRGAVAGLDRLTLEPAAATAIA